MVDSTRALERRWTSVASMALRCARIVLATSDERRQPGARRPGQPGVQQGQGLGGRQAEHEAELLFQQIRLVEGVAGRESCSPPTELTPPARVRRGFRRLHGTIGSPASPSILEPIHVVRCAASPASGKT